MGICQLEKVGIVYIETGNKSTYLNLKVIREVK